MSVQGRKQAHHPESEAVHLLERYGMIILGSALLMIAGAFFAPLGPLAGTPVRGLVTILAGSGGLGLLLGAGVATPPPLANRLRQSTWLRRLIVALALCLWASTLAGLTGTTWMMLHTPPANTYFTDIVSFSQVDADLVLSGHNPYTSDQAYRVALSRYPLAMGTALRGPVFGTSYTEPTLAHLAAVQRRYAAAPQTVKGAFDPQTLHSYPALSFLLYVPWLWAGGRNILLLNVLVYWAVFAWLVWLTPVGWRHYGALVALAAMPTVMASLIESNEVICIALVLLAWHGRERHWIGPILLGLACAFKQYAWFFVPFFTLEVVSAQGWRAGLRWAASGTAAFLLPNLPYLLASPKAWLVSLGLPITGQFFPQGMGLMQLSTSKVLPYGPPVLYACLEAAAMGACLWLFARARTQIGASVLVLALIPLFFAFRSMPNYFAFTPWLALYAVNVRCRVDMIPQPSPLVQAAVRAWRTVQYAVTGSATG